MTTRMLAATMLAALVLGVAPEAGAQASSNRARTAGLQPSQALPMPAPLPAPAADRFAPAPVPNLDVEPPRTSQFAERPRPEISPDLFIRREEHRGNGFVSGSAGRYEADRRMRVTPGINLKVPLQ